MMLASPIPSVTLKSNERCFIYLVGSDFKPQIAVAILVGALTTTSDLDRLNDQLATLQRYASTGAHVRSRPN